MTYDYCAHLWFALQVKPRREASVAFCLGQKGHESFLPVAQSWRDSKRTTEVQAPLFPGYVFCRFNSNAASKIVTTPGFVRIVGYGNVPVPIKNEEVEAIRTILRTGVSAEPWPFTALGTRVVIVAGPLRGLRGILVGTKRRCRVAVSVTLLRRSMAVELDPEYLLPDTCESRIL